MQLVSESLFCILLLYWIHVSVLVGFFLVGIFRLLHVQYLDISKNESFTSFQFERLLFLQNALNTCGVSRKWQKCVFLCLETQCQVSLLGAGIQPHVVPPLGSFVQHSGCQNLPVVLGLQPRLQNYIDWSLHPQLPLGGCVASNKVLGTSVGWLNSHHIAVKDQCSPLALGWLFMRVCLRHCIYLCIF